MDETGEGASEQAPQPLNKTARDSGKQPSPSLKKTSMSLECVGRVTIETLNKKGL
jgi:hypothetical protein